MLRYLAHDSLPRPMPSGRIRAAAPSGRWNRGRKDRAAVALITEHSRNKEVIIIPLHPSRPPARVDSELSTRDHPARLSNETSWLDRFVDRERVAFQWKFSYGWVKDGGGRQEMVQIVEARGTGEEWSGVGFESGGAITRSGLLEVQISLRLAIDRYLPSS